MYEAFCEVEKKKSFNVKISNYFEKMCNIYEKRVR